MREVSNVLPVPARWRCQSGARAAQRARTNVDFDVDEHRYTMALKEHHPRRNHGQCLFVILRVRLREDRATARCTHIPTSAWDLEVISAKRIKGVGPDAEARPNSSAAWSWTRALVARASARPLTAPKPPLAISNMRHQHSRFLRKPSSDEMCG